MTQIGQVTGVESNIVTRLEGNIVTIHPKTHAHIMFAQVDVKQGLIKYGEKGNHAVVKEL